jgi:hypothetical protein
MFLGGFVRQQRNRNHRSREASAACKDPTFVFRFTMNIVVVLYVLISRVCSWNFEPFEVFTLRSGGIQDKLPVPLGQVLYGSQVLDLES